MCFGCCCDVWLCGGLGWFVLGCVCVCVCVCMCVSVCQCVSRSNFIMKLPVEGVPSGYNNNCKSCLVTCQCNVRQRQQVYTIDTIHKLLITLGDIIINNTGRY